jgi:hypothetical protein
MSSRFIHVINEGFPFLEAVWIPLHIYTTFLFYFTFIDRFLGWFCVLAIVNIVGDYENSDILIAVAWIYTQFGIAGLYDYSVALSLIVWGTSILFP